MASKPGPPAFKPTRIQRRRVMRGIAAGLTMQQLADDLGVSIRTVRRAFTAEIKTARARLILDNLDRLHEAADSGNVSAMKTLLQMMQRWRPDLDEDEEEDDAWEDTVPNLARNPEIQKNGKTAGFED
jgi:AraC-like DNA-binding protein